MEELIFQTSQLLKQYPELLNHQLVGIAATELIGWLKGKFNKDSAKEKLKLIEEDNYTDETIGSFESHLEFILEDNENLQKELAEKVKQVEQLMVKEGISIKTNKINISGDHNITIQDVDSKGNISISH